jgi:epoxyqueuosine reductase
MMRIMQTGISNSAPGDRIDGRALAEKIRQWGKALGFTALGFARADAAQAVPRLERWLRLGRHGEMDYMAKHRRLRAAPQELLPGAATVIATRLPYWPQNAAPPPGETLPIARYALGRDYHRIVRRRLANLAGRIRAELEKTSPGVPFAWRAFSDSAPVMETEYAVQAGIAWRGKHTLTVSRQGSWHFLGEILTTLELPADAPAGAHCGSCRRCLQACPTAAIVAPYELDARLCISYLTIELRGAIPTALRPAIGTRVFGCDACQTACPWNRFARLGDPEFAARNGLDSARLAALINWDADEFDRRLAGSPIRRIGHERWLRNLAVALGNAPPTPETQAALAARANHPSPLVREHVAWALARTRGA